MRVACLALSVLCAVAAPVAAESQADIAAHANANGEALLQMKKFSDAEQKFIEATVRVPEPLYFTNLCEARYELGKFGAALQACTESQRSAPAPALATRTAALITKIRAAAKAQGIKLPE